MKIAVRPLATAVLLASVAVLAYRHNLSSAPVSDDWAILGRIESEGFFARWGGFLRPLTFLTFYLDHAIWRASPSVMHLENVLLHAAVAALVLVLARDLFRTTMPGAEARLGAARLGLGAAVLFLVHPSHSEAVAWISGRADVLAAGFTLAYLIVGLRYLRPENGAGLHLGLAGASLLLGLLAKESALAGPSMLLALAVGAAATGRAARSWSRYAALLSVSTVVVGCYLLARMHTLGSFFETGLPREPGVSALGFQIYRLILPAVREERWELAALSVQRTAAVTLLACLVVSLRRASAARPAAVTSFWIQLASLVAATLLALVPATGLTVRPHDGQGERFLYLASAPLCIAVASTLGFLLQRRRAAVAALVVLGAAGLWALDRPTRRWRAAGREVVGILDVLRRESRGRDLAILDLPDNYEGAYVFRSGLSEALNAGAPSSERVAVDRLSGCDIDRRPVEVELAPDGPDLWRFELRSPDQPLRFEGTSIARPGADGRSFVVSRIDLARWSDVYLYEGRALRRVDLIGAAARPP